MQNRYLKIQKKTPQQNQKNPKNQTKNNKQEAGRIN